MTTASVGTPSGSSSTRFANLAIAGFTYSAFALLLMHVLRPDYTPVDHMISDYAVGRFGGVMVSCFVSLGFACLMLLLGLVRTGPTSVVARIGTFLLAVPAIGLTVSACYPTDLETATVTTATGRIHDLSFFANIASIFLATALLSVGFGSHPRWRSHQRTALALSALIVVAFVLQILTLHRGAPYGIANRFFVAVLFAWLLSTSVRLRAVTREAGSPPTASPRGQ